MCIVYCPPPPVLLTHIDDEEGVTPASAKVPPASGEVTVAAALFSV